MYSALLQDKETRTFSSSIVYIFYDALFCVNLSSMTSASPRESTFDLNMYWQDKRVKLQVPSTTTSGPTKLPHSIKEIRESDAGVRALKV